MRHLLSHLLPLSLRIRFLLATAAVVMVLSLAYGLVALIGYSVSFDKTTFRLLRGESHLIYTLASWQEGKIEVALSNDLNLQSPTIALIYDANGKRLWAQRDVPYIENQIRKEWLKGNGFFELDTNYATSSALLVDDKEILAELKVMYDAEADDDVTLSIAVNQYPATSRMPALTIVMVDIIPIELKRSSIVWSWFVYVLLANLLLVVPLLLLAAWWSLRPIEALAREVRQLEKRDRNSLNPDTAPELTSLVQNLNHLLRTERERYDKYRTTLTDLTHSLKTPLAVLQSTLRSLRSNKISLEQAEPEMLEQISRISQQVGYYLHRANMRGNSELLNREIHSVAPLLDSLCSALNKVYQRKGVSITLDISPETIFVGAKYDFMEVMGNLLDNACKYCLEFVEVSAHQHNNALHMVIDDDGPGIQEYQREIVFNRGQRADTLRPGQGIGLSVVREIIEQYEGEIIVGVSPLGGTRMEVIFFHLSSPQDTE